MVGAAVQPGRTDRAALLHPAASAAAPQPSRRTLARPLPPAPCRAALAATASVGMAVVCHSSRRGSRPTAFARKGCSAGHGGSGVSTAMAARRGEDSGGGQPLWSLESPRVQLLAVLVLIFVANQACRALPYYLVDFGTTAAPEYAMNAALAFSSAEYGFYATLGFTVPFTLASLVAGPLADRSDRVRIVGIAGLLWSVFTASMAGASTYGALLAERGLLAVSQAVTNPAALSLIADLFPEARATANAIFGLGIYVGGGIASLGAAADQGVGWRSTCLAFGAASLAISSLALAAPADPRGESGEAAADADAAAPRGRANSPGGLGELASDTLEAVAPPPARWLLLASWLRFCAGFAILVWLPPVVRARYPGDVESFAFYNSLIKAFAGGASSLSGGLAADALRARGLGERAGAVFAAVSSLLAAPLWFMTLSPDLSFEGCMGLLLVEYLVAEGWLGPAVAALQAAVPPKRRGAAQGVFSALTALGNLLPASLGLLAANDLAFGCQASVAVCYVASAACFVMAAANLPEGGGSEQ
uniref:Major facilitator superfamily (MFS) profile domain-containing protein n=1 Tax=Alexandrium monilatum TaxID=311494 RepID=A0A7S4WIE6_9DINO